VKTVGLIPWLGLIMAIFAGSFFLIRGAGFSFYPWAGVVLIAAFIAAWVLILPYLRRRRNRL